MNGFPGPIMLGFHETIFKFSSPRDAERVCDVTYIRIES